MRRRAVLWLIIAFLALSIPLLMGSKCEKTTVDVSGHSVEDKDKEPHSEYFYSYIPYQDELGMPVYDKNVVSESVTATKSSLTGTPDEYEIHYETTDSFQDVVWFFDEADWEVQVKVLDAADMPDSRFWVFDAATTDLEHVLKVTDMSPAQPGGGTSIDIKPFGSIETAQ